MSRTFKDRPYKVRNKETAEYWTLRTFWGDRNIFTKKRKEIDTEDHWMSTPSWWVNLFMTRPQRHACRMWERNCIKATSTDIIEDEDCPDFKKKPHKYYW